jgi:hypothetical protein
VAVLSRAQDGFEFALARGSSFEEERVVLAGTVPSAFAFVNNLNPTTTYTFRVRPVGGAWGEPSSFSTTADYGFDGEASTQGGKIVLDESKHLATSSGGAAGAIGSTGFSQGVVTVTFVVQVRVRRSPRSRRQMITLSLPALCLTLCFATACLAARRGDEPQRVLRLLHEALLQPVLRVVAQPVRHPRVQPQRVQVRVPTRIGFCSCVRCRRAGCACCSRFGTEEPAPAGLPETFGNPGDVIIVTLDLDAHTMQCSVNGEDAVRCSPPVSLVLSALHRVVTPQHHRHTLSLRVPQPHVYHFAAAARCRCWWRRACRRASTSPSSRSTTSTRRSSALWT